MYTTLVFFSIEPNQMGVSISIKQTILLFSLLFLHSPNLSSATKPQPTILSYHNGPTLLGHNLSLTILWYGRFTPPQKSILLDFLTSLTISPPPPNPSVSQWWQILDNYKSLIPTKPHTNTSLRVTKQKLYDSYPLGRVMTRSHISSLAQKFGGADVDIVVVFTDETVAVEGFCMSSCGTHGRLESTRAVYLWVGNSETQCPGQCAWPFHQPIYGPQAPPLVAPNGDVGADGMVIGLAATLASAVTNPNGTGFFEGDAAAPVEVAAACGGVYGKGAYPGYAGEVLVDEATGGGYNAHGVQGRKFLLPALWDPVTMGCVTLV